MSALANSELQRSRPAPTSWRPRMSFETPEGFVAYTLRHLADCWALSLRGEAVAAVSVKLPPALCAEKVAREAAASVEDFGRRLCQRSLPTTLVAKLEEMCMFISDREYAQANKVYMDLAIGSKRWLTDMPVLVSFSMSRQDTEVKWTPDCGNHPIDEAGLRDHVVMLRRLLTVAQALRPNEDPSRNCG